MTFLFLETTQPLPKELHVSQQTTLISGQSLKDPQAFDPADWNAENESVKEKASAYETSKQDKANIAKIESKISPLASLKESGLCDSWKYKSFKEILRSELKKNQVKLKKFTHPACGRPPLEGSYPNLHQSIADLATAGAGADFRRRTNVLNTCQTLDSLRSALLKEAHVLSCQALYPPLIPRRSDSNEGKHLCQNSAS